jgi:hypothetical protein
MRVIPVAKIINKDTAALRTCIERLALLGIGGGIDGNVGGCADCAGGSSQRLPSCSANGSASAIIFTGEVGGRKEPSSGAAGLTTPIRVAIRVNSSPSCFNCADEGSEDARGGEKIVVGSPAFASLKLSLPA